MRLLRRIDRQTKPSRRSISPSTRLTIRLAVTFQLAVGVRRDTDLFVVVVDALRLGQDPPLDVFRRTDLEDHLVVTIRLADTIRLAVIIRIAPR